MKASEHPDDASLSAALIGGKRLRTLLGFDSGEAFRAAVRAGRIPVGLMKIQGRKGWFSRAADVDAWLASLTPNLSPASTPLLNHSQGSADASSD